MKDLLLGVAQAVRAKVGATGGPQRGVLGHHDSPGGDAQFDIDEVAEKAAWQFLTEDTTVPVAVYTEDEGIRKTGDRPEILLVIDPIDGTRPAAAGLESSMVSVAAAPYTSDPALGDVVAGLLLELNTGRWLYSGPESDQVEAHGYDHPVPTLTTTTEIERMFWSIEFNGHPMRLMSDAYAHLVDASANTGGVFVFNSSTYSISRIVTGQLDAYVDIGNRLLRDDPTTEAAFRTAGRGNILHLFPYDIAAVTRIAQHAGVTITDGYGNGLESMSLLDLGPFNQRSCIAAATGQLHEALLDSIRWNPTPATTQSGGN